MRRIALLLVLAGFSGSPRVQGEDSLEVRGSVLEIGSDGTARLPVEGVQVNLIELVHAGPNVERAPVAAAYTDPRGEYRFHPEHTGDYWVEIKQENYIISPSYGASVKLGQTHPSAQSTFTLVRHGSTVTGRVVDEDGQPVSGLHLAVQTLGTARAGFNYPGDGSAVTGTDGGFTSSDVAPGPHVVRITSRAGILGKAVPHFSAEDLEIVDEDIETSYWPGGTASPSGSVPVSPGGSASVGTIRIRKVPLYRAHVSVPHVECAAGEKWVVRAVSSGEALLERPSTIPCVKDFLVMNLRPGMYTFRLEKDEPAPVKWALASANITSKNIQVDLALEPESQVFGRFIAAEGARLPSLDKLRVSTIGIAREPSAVYPDADGNFVLTNLKFPDHRVRVDGLTKGYYVQELRLNGASSPGDSVTFIPGANQLQIVIDDKPGAVSGTVSDADTPAADAQVSLYPKDLPLTGLPPIVPGGSVRADKNGRFQIDGLTPGEYRIIAWQPPTPGRPMVGDIRTQLAAHAQSVTVERGGTSTVDLKLSDLSR